MSKKDILSALCREAQKLGVTPTEFWKRVYAQDDEVEEAAHLILSDIRSGGTSCGKCGGSGEFHYNDGHVGNCYWCRGKGYQNPGDIRRCYGHKKNNPHMYR